MSIPAREEMTRTPPDRVSYLYSYLSEGDVRCQGCGFRVGSICLYDAEKHIYPVTSDSLTEGAKKTILSVWLLLLVFVFGSQWESVTSDSVEVLSTPEGLVSYLRGSVVVTMENTVIRGSEAFVYEGEERAVVLDVHVDDVDVLVRGDTLTYYRVDDRAVVSGDVRLETADETIHADRVVYLRRERTATASGDVRVVSMKDDVVATGGRGEYDLAVHSGRLLDSPVLLVKGRGDTRVESDAMLIYQQSHKASAVGDVTVSMRTGVASCDSLDYDWVKGIACMWGDPRIDGSNGWVTGDTVKVLFEEREVANTCVVGNASAEYDLGDGSTNAVSGDTIEMLFHQGEMESIVVKGSAEGKYIEATKD